MVKKVIHYFNLNSYKKVNFMVAFIAFTITYFVENIIKDDNQLAYKTSWNGGKLLMGHEIRLLRFYYV